MCRYVLILFKAENDNSMETLVVGMITKKAGNFVTSGNAYPDLKESNI
jgi:hypothetical protein